jgi:hypothetical protein
MNLNDIIGYIVKYYPKPNQLSKARLNKVLYLIDWKSVLKNEEQMTKLDWIYNHYGPYVDEVETSIIIDKRFVIERTTNIYGNEKNIIKTKLDATFEEPSKQEKKIIDFIIEKTNRYNFTDFIKLVYSTYPIISQPQGSQLNLVELANEYKEIKNGITN